MSYRKKLIEVSLPLEAINAASAREKSIRHGHPSTLHLWWARRPLAAARAVLFAQLVDDPSSWPELFATEEAQNAERQRLFRLIEQLVIWENSNSKPVINAARLEIARSHARSATGANAKAVLAADVSVKIVNEYLATELPPVQDPFAGGGTIPLEAQRLGLRAVATDLNPVALLINKALLELPQRYAGQSPVNPAREERTVAFVGGQGLASDLLYYGGWMRDEARRRIGSLYPDVQLPERYGGGTGTVIAWLWARTVPSPDPAFGSVDVPLVPSFWLSEKVGSEAWLEPEVERSSGRWRFVVKYGAPKDPEVVSAGTKVGRGDFRCILSGAAIPVEYVRRIGRERGFGNRLIAIVAEGNRSRRYVTVTEADEVAAACPIPEDIEDTELPEQALGFRVQAYGLRTHRALFTSRQLTALRTFTELAREVRARVVEDAIAAGRPKESARQYSEAVGTYLGLTVGKACDYWSTLCVWHSGASHQKVANTFSRQTLSMTFSFAEANPFSVSSGHYYRYVELVAEVVSGLGIFPSPDAQIFQADAATTAGSAKRTWCTDPPYYDNIGYAALSDFFYVWLRRTCGDLYPELFTTVLVPKADEMIAEPGRHSNRGEAVAFFEQRLGQTFTALSATTADAPVAIFYAFRQAEAGATEDSVATGWETLLRSVLASGLAVDGTWPIRTEQGAGLRLVGRNALASSVVLACRARDPAAVTVTRADFKRILRKELPDALKKLQQGNIAPVDVAQASIGPGMAVFSRHKQVSEADGSAMSVRSALQLINEVLDEYLASGEGDFDADTRFAITWYEQFGWEAGPFGDAETLAKARNVSVSGVEDAGICRSAANKVRILKRPEMRPLEYDPATDERPTIWEFTQHMIRLLETDGEEAAASLLKKLGSASNATRELAYRLYNTCERRKWSEDARSYNGLILAWPELEKLAAKIRDGEPPAPASLGGSDGQAAAKSGKKSKAQKKGQQNLFAGNDK